MVQALEVPDYVSGSGIKLCIIDTGYDLGHEDLQTENISGDGPCQDVPCNWYEDPNSHGTHVAGTIGAIGGNDKGVVGVVRNGGMPLHIVRGLNGNGSGTWAGIIRGMQQCDESGANVVNMSLGGGYSRAMEDALDSIIANNDRILFVAAAGNGGNAGYLYPASFDSPGMMSVASVDKYKNRSSFSQYNDQVDISAPGSSVLSTVPGNKYATYSGTSMATPHVAAVAALIWSHHSRKTAAEIRDALESSAEDLGTYGRDDYYGNGLVNTKAALDALSEGWPSVSPAPTTVPTQAPIVSCTDSPLAIVWKGNKRKCRWVGNAPNRCNNPQFHSHCPSTCGCGKYNCIDSLATFVWLRKEVDCEWLRNLEQKKREKRCTKKRIRKTCRETCKFCSRENKILDFDEVDASVPVQYFRTDINVENWYVIDGAMNYPDSGYDHGTISEPNVGFNGFANPMTISCPGGSFDLLSIWLTPAWDENLEVSLDGYRNGSLSTSFSAVLESPTIPTFFKTDLETFKNVDSIVISSNPNHVAVDELMIEVSSPCIFEMIQYTPSNGTAAAAL